MVLKSSKSITFSPEKAFIKFYKGDKKVTGAELQPATQRLLANTPRKGNNISLDSLNTGQPQRKKRIFLRLI